MNNLSKLYKKKYEFNQNIDISIESAILDIL